MRWEERVAKFIGDTHRAIAILLVAGAAAWAIAADYTAEKTGAALAGLSALYWGRVWENREQAKHSAQVETAKAGAGQPTGTIPPAKEQP